MANASPQIQTHEPAGKATARILIAEDTAITQDLVKLLLNQRGHDVTIAHDGASALRILLQEDFDVVLMDYMMPEHNGIEVVQKFRAARPDGMSPVFIAMTADVEALQSGGGDGSEFWTVLRKPFEFPTLFDLVDEAFASRGQDPRADGAAVADVQADGPVADDREDDGRSGGEEVALLQSRAPDAATGPDAALRLLRWPGDFGQNGISPAASKQLISGLGFDAVLVTESARASELEQLWKFGDLHLLPIIDEVGSLGARADFVERRMFGTERNQALREKIEDFGRRAQSVHGDLRSSKTLADKLLARIYVQGETLSVARDGNELAGVRYSVALDPEPVVLAAQELVKQRLVEPVFFDRVHRCPSCNSSRLNVREECVRCRSGDIAESTLIHHFRCAHQAPTEDFRAGPDLICPKCERELRHFGADYDKPGHIFSCNGCGHSAPDVEIGFVCLDCDTHTDGAVIKTMDIFSYSLSERGRTYVREGQVAIGGIQTSLRLNEFSMDLLIAINRLARDYNSNGAVFSLLSISYPDRVRLVEEAGARQTAAARAQFLENLRGLLGGETDLHRTEQYDYLLLPGLEAAGLKARSSLLSEKAAATLRLDFRPRVSVFGPEDLGQ